MSKDFDPNKVDKHTAYNDYMDCPELGEGVGEYVNAGDYDQLLALYNASKAALREAVKELRHTEPRETA